MKTTTVRIPDDLHGWLRARSYETRESMNSIIVSMLEREKTMESTTYIVEIPTQIREEFTPKDQAIARAEELAEDYEDVDGNPMVSVTMVSVSGTSRSRMRIWPERGEMVTR